MSFDVQFAGRTVCCDVLVVDTVKGFGNVAELVKEGTDGAFADTVGTIGNPGEVEGVVGVFVDVKAVGIVRSGVADFSYEFYIMDIKIQGPPPQTFQKLIFPSYQ